MLFKSFFSNVISVLFCFVLVSISTHAQSASYLDSLDGKYALQFQIESLFSLSDFQGSTLSGKYNFTSREALRLGISIGVNDSKIDNNINEFDSTRTYYLDGDANMIYIRINTQYIYHILSTNDVSFFTGGGPFVSFSESEGTRKTIRNGEEINRKNSYDGFNLGLELLLGVEWMFYNNMTLSAEYGINGSYSKFNNKIIEEITLQNSTTKSFGVNYNSVKFGLSVYF